jgi:hypothetical protein
MSTAAVYVGIAAAWVLAAALVIAAVVWVSRRRRGDARMSQQLAALQATVAELTAQLAELKAREPADAPMAAPDPAPGPADPVAVITRVPDSVDPELSTSRVASVTLAGPLLKAAAFSYGLRHALHEEQRMRISYAMRKELRRQRKLRRHRRAQSRSEGRVS